MKETTGGRLLLAIALLTAAAGCREKRDAAREDFTRGVRAYLERRGDLCVGRPSWPIDVPVDARLGPDLTQLPALERLGLVTSSVIAERREGVATPFEARRYRLTAAGRARYLDRETRLPASPEDPRAAERSDFCPLALTLAQVTKGEVQQGGATALVSYTYAVEAPPWTRDAGFQKAFPAVARVVAGAGRAELVEGFTLTAAGWMANELLPKPGARPLPLQAAAP
jgi:hypothetical protein